MINETTDAIIGAAIKVHQSLGPGLLESAYQACLAYELQKTGLQIKQQQPIPVVYDKVKLDCGYRADLIVNGQVIVELKAKETLHPIDKAQVLSHLRLTHLTVGLLLNFHEVRLVDGIRRIVNNYKGTPPDSRILRASLRLPFSAAKKQKRKDAKGQGET